MHTQANGIEIMEQQKKERWIQLCELASREQDPERLSRLVAEINRLLDEKDQSLNMARDGSSG
jgi:hypothetical protein